MRFNPAASFDLGYEIGASKWSTVDDVHFDEETVAFAEHRYEVELEDALERLFARELAASYVEEPLPL